MAEVQGKVIELQTTIMAAQSSAISAQAEQATVIHEVTELKDEIARMKTWGETKQQYRLINPWPGAFFYSFKKPEREPAEPAHWICAKCYEDGRKSILQLLHQDHGRRREFTCFVCKSVIEKHHNVEISYAE